MMTRRLALVLAWLALTNPASVLAASRPFTPDLLRAGGYVLVMRHAHSPGQPPPPGTAAPANGRGERQLDAVGESTARTMGQAIRSRHIPIAVVLTSPTFRAVQTAEILGLGPAKTAVEIGDGGASMSGAAAGAQGDQWLKRKAAEAPPRGSNVLLITHGPNIDRAFGLRDVADGETLIFQPDGHGGAVLEGRVKIDEWSTSP